MPLQATSGAASYDAFGGGAAAVPQYIEDVFSTYLYTGNSPSTQSIVNGIDLATYGGMVWCKSRNYTYNHCVMDTARGNSAGNILFTNLTSAQQSAPNAGISSYNSNGFSLRYDDGWGTNEPAGSNIASWTFRKQPKFFDVVTYTGNGSGNRIITSSLGSPIGCVFIKRTDDTSNWAVAHRKDGSAVATGFQLNTTAAALYPNSTNDTFDATGGFNAGYVTDSSGNSFNVNGASYVAYLFAHNAGGFGLTGTDNVISCGSYTGTGSDMSVTLGYEPQYVMIKRTDSTGDWWIGDTMRGFNLSGVARLEANTSDAEAAIYNGVQPTSTGFFLPGGTALNGGGDTFIYIAIRRGPMKVPTSGTSVFAPLYEAGTGSARTVNAGFPTDLFFIKDSTGLTGPTAGGNVFYDRLRGNSNVLQTQSTAAEAVSGTYTALFNSVQNGVVVSDYWSSYAYREYCFQRAPSFFDEVCYTGTGSATTQTHNLGVVPEMMIVKCRSTGGVNWSCYHSALGNTQVISLNEDIQAYTASQWNNTTPTSTVFSVGTQDNVNGSAKTYVAYLFATCAGVSKVGSYTGTATTKQVDCGFTGGARFVLIKRTDEVASGNPWYVWDSARGIVAGNDPYLLLNSSAAEVTNTDYVDTYSAGFEISSTAPAAINASGGTFIFLAIA
jgi:hypothetical protein